MGAKKIFLKNQKGSILITVYVIVALLSVLAVASIDVTVNEYSSAKRKMLKTEMHYLAEGGVEYVVSSIANKIAEAGYDEPSSILDYIPSSDFDMPPVNYLPSGFTWENITCQYVWAEDESDPSSLRHYILSAAVKHIESGEILTLNQRVSRKRVQTFQHVVFYDLDLEILPGPDMILSGKIHCNGDIYADCGDTLTIDTDVFHSSGNIFNKRKNEVDSHSSGDVSIKEYDSSNYYDMEDGGIRMDSDNPNWANGALGKWGGTVKSGVHGVNSIAIPGVGSIASDSYYANQANVTVEGDSVYSNGNLLVEGVPDANGDLPPGTHIPVGTISTSNGFYDQRENEYVEMTTIDLKKMAGYVEYTDQYGEPQEKQGTNYLPDNGLLYATTTGSFGRVPGVKLINGSEIHSGTSSGRNVGLTVVSNDPVYIQGDYNTTNKKPASVICDAFNILSNSWDDANSSRSLYYREASETTLNLGVISGIVPTPSYGGGNYSGGFENLSRFHEDWRNKAVNIRGAFVVLWESDIATSPWGSASYSAPIRNWNYDPDFDTMSNLPSYTPYAIEMARIVWWEDFKE